MSAPKDELDKPSTLLAAAGFGAAFPALVWLGHLNGAGHIQRPAWYFAIGLAIFATYIGLAHGGRGLLHAVVAIASAFIEVARKWREAFPKPTAPPPDLPSGPSGPAKVEVIRRIGGKVDGQDRAAIGREVELIEYRSPRWIRWQEFGRTMLDWAELLNGIHGALLVGEPIRGVPRAFGKDSKAWVAGTSGMAAAGLVPSKQMGVTCRLAYSVQVCREKIESGTLAWPEDADPPRVNQATPLLTIRAALHSVRDAPPALSDDSRAAPQAVQSQGQS